MAMFWGTSKEEKTNTKFNQFIQQSNIIDEGPPVRYQLQSKIVNLDGETETESKLKKCTFGTKDPKSTNKTILLVGETGTGKSTLINALVNYVMGVKFNDKIWFEIIVDKKEKCTQAETQTTDICVYEVFGFENSQVPFSLTIIDTPGYGDTRGIEYDDIITHKLQDLFCSTDAVTSIDMVGLVVKASINRVHDRLAYTFNSVTSLFAENIEDNIVILMTHSDGLVSEDAITALKEAKIKCAKDENSEPICFLFNNRQTTNPKNNRQVQHFQGAWDTSWDGMKDLMVRLGGCTAHSLVQTVQVMKMRIKLTACIGNLLERVDNIEAKQNAIKTNTEELTKHENEILENKDYEIEVSDTKKVKVPIDHWFYSKAVICKVCEENCHYPGCTMAVNPSWCEVMKNNRCTSCTRKCPVEAHVKVNKKYVTRTIKVKKTKANMKAKYDENKAESERKTTLQEEMMKEMEDLQKSKVQYLNEAYGLILELEKIALNKSAVSILVHLNFLAEKMEETGEKERAQKLKSMMSAIDKPTWAATLYVKGKSKK